MFEKCVNEKTFNQREMFDEIISIRNKASQFTTKYMLYHIVKYEIIEIFSSRLLPWDDESFGKSNFVTDLHMAAL